jgi:site-specific DNA-methyltransferase (adenine-specific)
MRIELAKIADDSVSLILTDPPYSFEYLSLWKTLAEVSARILKPSGFLIAYSGQLYLDKVMSYLGKHLIYYWLASLWLKGATSHRFERNIQNAFKPILIYQKPPLVKGEWMVDLLESPSADKRFHDWGQSESPIAILVDTFSSPGDMVVDPFCGGGVVPYICQKLKRRCLAIDNDFDAYQSTLRRLKNDKETL